MTTTVEPPAQAQRRVTPTAVRILGADAPRDQWLTERRKGIGSSDVAAILGVTDNRTPLHVWYDKRGQLADEDPTEPMLWGTLLEDTVAREWARRNRSVIQRVGLIARHDTPWAMATLDRRVAECPLNRDTRTACALEVKCRNAFTASRWRADVPDDVLAQVMWQMWVTGYDHIHVAVLIGGSDYRQAVVRRDPQVVAFILGEVERFRTEHLLPGVRPVVDDPAKAQALNDLDAALHPDRVGVVEIDVEAIGEVMEYAAASAAKSVADRRLKAARARLAQAADGHQVATFANELAYEFTPTHRRNVDMDRLAERWPDAYADCVAEKTSYSIRIAGEYRHKGATDDQ